MLTGGLLSVNDFEDEGLADTFLKKNELTPHGTRILPVYLLALTKAPRT